MVLEVSIHSYLTLLPWACGSTVQVEGASGGESLSISKLLENRESRRKRPPNFPFEGMPTHDLTSSHKVHSPKDSISS